MNIPGIGAGSGGGWLGAGLRALAAGLVLSLAACGDGGSGTASRGGEAGAGGELSGRLTLTGSSTIAPLAGEIAKRFESEHPEVRIDVQTGGSSRGVADATQGLADIGMVSRELKDGEEQLTPTTIARDGITLIVHADNPVSELSRQQVIDVYSGRVGDWSELVEGFDGGAVTVVNKAEGRSTLELFLAYFELKNSQIQADVVIGDNQQGIKQVAGDPAALGYVSIGTAEYAATHGQPIKLLPMGGVAASIASVKGGAFPLARPLNLVTAGEPSGLVRAFLEFASSSRVNDLVEGQYFVPVAD